MASFGTPQGQPAAGDAFLKLGIRQVEEGSFEDALFTLDTAVRRLSGEPARLRELVQAYVYLGAAYMGLDHEHAAKGKFRRALGLDPELRLSPEQFPQRVVKAFAEEQLKMTAVRKKRGARTFLLLGGVGAAAAAGISAATSGGLPANRPPAAARINVAPEGQVIPNVTNVTFSASAADPDGDSLSYRWDLGDGTAESGEVVSHVYLAAGAFAISLTISDGRGGTVSVQGAVTARSLSGAWRVEERRNEFSEHQCTQTLNTLDCHVTRGVPGTEFVTRWFGRLAHPRNVDLEVTLANNRFVGRCVGEVQPDLDSIRCVSQAGDILVFQRAGSSP